MLSLDVVHVTVAAFVTAVQVPTVFSVGGVAVASPAMM